MPMQTARLDLWPNPIPFISRMAKDGDGGDEIPPFEAVSQNLAKLHLTTIDIVLQSPAEVEDFDIPDIRENRETSPTPPPVLPPQESKQPIKLDGLSKMQCIAQLHHTCQRVFGKTGLLKFEFVEDNGPNTKRCILTITRPNGIQRSYQTPGVYSRKNEAKSQTAALAIEMGALDFIATGDPDPTKPKKGLVLAPLDATSESNSVVPQSEGPAVQEIEACCIEWRTGRVKPYWVALNEPKFGTKQGCALRIELSPHAIRVYSSETKYETLAEAKAACAKVAIDQGVLEYIRHGNGQTGPEKPPISMPDADADAQEAHTKATYTPPTPLTLQAFYETFPQPFPENLGDKSAAEINAPSWLNTAIQGARGAKLSTNFIWTTNGTPWGGSLGLHGCLLRLERPQESRSYLVDARFLKRADAKSAVCLQAISQGVGDYIRRIGQEIEHKINPIMRRWANDLIFPMLGSECSKVKPGTHPRYDFYKEKDAYGCTMTLELSSFPTHEERKTFRIPADYRTKADAKIALACLAVEQGAIEFLRFRGNPPPPEYQTFYTALISGMAEAPNKRKSREDDGPQDRKKSKIDTREGEPPVPLLETKGEAMARRNYWQSSRPNQFRGPRSGNNSTKKNPISGAIGAMLSSAQGPSMGQMRTGSRAMGNPTYAGSGSQVSTAPRPGPRVPAPPALSRTGPVMLGVPVSSHSSFNPAPQGHPGYGGPQVALPQVNQCALRPPQSFPQARSYSVADYPTVPVTSGYYPPSGNSMPPGMSTYGQYPGVATEGSLPSPAPPRYPQPYASPATPGLPYGPFPRPSPAGRQIPPHMFQFQHQSHFPYAGVAEPHRPSIPLTPAPQSGPIGQPEPTQSQKVVQLLQALKNQPPCGPVQTKNISEGKPAINTNSSDACTPAGTPAKSYITLLIDHCTEQNISQPRFDHKVVPDCSGKTMHKVWVILNKEKLGLSMTFANVDEGREMVSKYALIRLQKQAKIS